MRALVNALSLVTLAGSNEQTAAHGLRAAVRRSNALISNTRRGSEAGEGKETLQPFLVLVDLAQIVEETYKYRASSVQPHPSLSRHYNN